jgi:hypothetical protein
MATQDGNIAYDMLFVDEFYHHAYPDGTDEHKSFYVDTVLRGEIQISTFIENAIAKAGGLERNSKFAMDLDDGSEVKSAVSSYRNNHVIKGQWMHTYEISNVHTKTGPLRIVGYNKIIKKFEFYFIPNSAFSHLKGVLTLPIETYSGYYASLGMSPTFTGVRTSDSKWHQYQVADFITMCKMRAPTPPNISLPVVDSDILTKNDPIPQNAIPYSQYIEWLKTRDSQETPPTDPCVIS